MLKLRDISIQNKLVLMQVFTSVMVLGLCFIVFVISDIKGYKERKINSTITIAEVIASNSKSALEFMDNETGSDILQTVENDVVNAAILDHAGKEFAAYTKDGEAEYQFKSPGKDGYAFDEEFLYVYKTIQDHNEILGTVCLRIEMTQLQVIINQKFQIAAILLSIGVGLAFLIAFINQRHISAPLLNLVKVMKEIRENNDYKRHVKIEGQDEISILCQEFNNLMDEVVNSHQKKDEFIGIASHELKTPLTSIKLYLETLSRMEHTPTTKAFVIKARENVNKLQNLITDLLDVSKIQSGQLQLNLKELDIEKLLDECIQDARINNTHHTLIWEANQSNSVVLADRDRLEQVIVNLLSNAIKYSPEGKNIEIKTKIKAAEIVVSIKDFGIGIPKSEHKKIFERFYRAKGSNEVNSGFGLGLYICSQIILRHNGAIWVESEEGKGSAFYFKLPVNKA